jgi:hypothetical protein
MYGAGSKIVLGVFSLALLMYSASGQTTQTPTQAEATPPAAKTKPVPPPKPAPKPRPTRAAKNSAAAATSATPSGGTTANSAKGATTPVAASPAKGTVPASAAATSSPAANAVGTAMNAASTVGGLPSRMAGSAAPAPAAGAVSGANSRSSLATQGLGTFRGADYTLTAYGCYRTGTATRVLCDFDITKQRGAQANVAPFNNVVVVDNGGKIVKRKDAYYMGQDGTHMPAAYLSTSPVRYVMEFDDVADSISSVSLVRGREQIQSVPISAAANQK